MKDKRQIRLPLAAALLTPLAMSFAGCAAGPPAYPGGATEAVVFFTPEIRQARDRAGIVYRAQSPEYARRDHLLGAAPRDAVELYSRTPRSRTIVQHERVRATATPYGYTVTEESSVRVRQGWTNPFAGHRRR